MHILEKLLATQVVKLHKWCSVFGATVIGIMIYFLVDLHLTECLKDGLVEPKCERRYGITSMALFFLLSIALLASTYHLIRTLKSSHADEMVREADVLMGLFITYALSYFLRALFFVGLGKYGKMWQNVFPKWSCSKI